MARSPGVISGVVLGPKGKPVSEARVYFTAGPSPLPEIAALTDSSGSFSLTAPVPGEYVVEAVADPFRAQSSTVKVKGGEQVRLDLQLKK
ncbi:MAG TPA: carboxypeptidase-like regulatory domain-containing protein [Pyrinomonadaceae bacterium]|nr:carboxypeptidase-like regulatory domain-containing protein [Pyrinomonadaceae bacterium]